MDVFLDHFSDTAHTGKIRGLFFTLINSTWAISPLIAAFIIESKGIITVYSVGIISVGVALTIIFSGLRKTTFKKRPIHSLQQVYIKNLKNKDLRNIFSLSALLHISYVISLIYIPLYLHNSIGFAWIDIGLLILISNIPFLFLGYPIGYIADTYIGEQELLITGLIIAALGTFGFSLITTTSFAAWSIVFIISRIGMSIVETTTESYLFKKIDTDDTETLSIQRNAIPVGYLLGPLVGFIVSLFTESYEPIFIILAGLFIVGLYPATQLNDTK
jgi:MFS family permease